MRKRLLLLLLLLPLLVGCTRQGDAVPYEAEHRHVYGFWYEAEDGTEVVLRTVVMLDSNGDLITKDVFPVGAKIAYAQGVVDAYNGEYQLKIFSPDDIVFAD